MLEKAGPPHSGDGASLEEVEKIVETRRSEIDGDKNEFKIRWKGYGPGDDTWEPEEALLCPDLVEAFWEERRVYHDPGLGGDYRDRKDAADYASDDSEPEVADHFALVLQAEECSIVQVVEVTVSVVEVTEKAKHEPELEVTEKMKHR